MAARNGKKNLRPSIPSLQLGFVAPSDAFGVSTWLSGLRWTPAAAVAFESACVRVS
jgi:hypothetical protein